jgi:hypothetical protein
MTDRYAALVAEMKQTHALHVRKWRTASSGVAWTRRDHRGVERRYIESPYPRGPMSCAIFLHEVGHHAIGLGRYRPRCLEEYHAWRWALEAMHVRGFKITEAVLRRRDRSLQYAVAKACRRGLAEVPVELQAYAPATTALRPHRLRPRVTRSRR